MAHHHPDCRAREEVKGEVMGRLLPWAVFIPNLIKRKPAMTPKMKNQKMSSGMKAPMKVVPGVTKNTEPSVMPFSPPS